MIEDAELLRRYAEERSESAFAELVRRRVNLVYSVALRQVGGDVHLAEDVTQKVFADLSRKAASLHQRPVLTGWLFRSAQFAATDVVRSERRRRAREQETHLMHATTSNPPEVIDWEKIRPVLDEVMGELNDHDRDAVALRFFEERPFADIGRALGLTEDAARKRVTRALDKLHGLLARRGVSSTSTAALALALANQAGMAAPASVVSSITASAGALVAAGGAVASGAGIFVFLSSTKAIVGATIVLASAAAGTAFYQVKHRTSSGSASVAVATANHDMRANLSSPELALDAQSEPLEFAAVENREPAKSLVAASTSTSGSVTAVVPLTRDELKARYRRALELARSGDYEAALAEYLWCFDEGMLKISSYSSVRSSFLLNEIMQLGKNYPPAIAALRERRDQAKKRFIADATDRQAGVDFSAINRSLKQDEQTLAYFDGLEFKDPRREILLSRVYQILIDAQRYQEALRTFPFARMDQSFDLIARLELNEKLPNQKSMIQARRLSVTKNIEVLAGAGEIANARILIGKLLALDSSNETQALLQTGLARAGRLELLATPKP